MDIIHPGWPKRSQKKIKETDAIFDAINEDELADSPSDLLVSIDTKAVVKVGDFSRKGKTRFSTQALDHDFPTKEKVTPIGIFLPEHDDLHLFMATSKVTSDCIVDCLDAWCSKNKLRFPQTTRLTILQDNGPENSGRRTQFFKRIVDFVQKHQIDIRLVYYPPYHSKYNPVERCWGALENHWSGSILDTINTVVKFAKTMTWKGVKPVVSLIKKHIKLESEFENLQ